MLVSGSASKEAQIKTNGRNKDTKAKTYAVWNDGMEDTRGQFVLRVYKGAQQVVESLEWLPVARSQRPLCAR